MVDLIRALIQVKTPLTLFAFVSLVFLAAFRTKGVPELFFGLAKEKLTKERFAQLLHRFMLFGFIAFVLLCGMAAVGQVLAYKTQGQVSLNELRDELKNVSASEAQREAALKAYADGLAYIQQHDLAQAIQALHHSIDAIPTLSAQTTLAFLYQKQGDQESAMKYAASAQSLANQRGDSLALVRLQQLSEGGGGDAGTDMVGDKKPFPEGGKSFEDAMTMSPGLYLTTHDVESGQLRYYKMRLKAGQTLRIKFRSPDTGGDTFASIYDANGGLKQSDGIYGERNELKTVQWNTPVDGLVYLSVGNYNQNNAANSVYRISIQ